MSDRNTYAMDGFGKVKPLSEGYVVKGGINATTQVTTRPPPPRPMRPAASTASGATETAKTK